MVIALAYVALIAAFVGAIHTMIGEGKEFIQEINAELEVQRCAGLIDAMTSNKGVEFFGDDFACIMKDERVVSVKYETGKSEKPLNSEIELTDKAGVNVIVVKGRKHYAE